MWTLGEIGIAVMFGVTFADLAPADLRGRYMGVASTTWSLGAVLGPLLGTALRDHTCRTALGRHARRPGSRCSPRSRLSPWHCAAEISAPHVRRPFHRCGKPCDHDRRGKRAVFTSVVTTADLYGHRNPEADRHAVEVMDQMIGQEIGEVVA